MIRGICIYCVGGGLLLYLGLGSLGISGLADVCAADVPAAGCHACAPVAEVNDPNKPLTLQAVLARTQVATDHIESLECQLIYEFLQPFHESQTTRKGNVYYRRLSTHSELRIHFATKKEDDTREVRYREDLFFDGVWRTHVDYQGRTAQRDRLAPDDEPIDALELVGQSVPIFGFSGMESLQETYAIELLPPDADGPDNLVHLRLIPDANALPENEYLSVDVWLNRETWLPAQVEAENIEEDIYRLQFPELKLNQAIDATAFEVSIPEGFGTTEVVPQN